MQLLSGNSFTIIPNRRLLAYSSSSESTIPTFRRSTARAKTPRTSRSKPAANPWQSLPRLADLFDSQTPQPFFKGSKVSALEESALTETQLLDVAAREHKSPGPKTSLVSGPHLLRITGYSGPHCVRMRPHCLRTAR